MTNLRNNRYARPQLTLSPERLEGRQLFSVSPVSANPPLVEDWQSASTDTFRLHTLDPERAVVTIRNTSAADAEFTVRFNGNLSVNLQDLVKQIRSSTDLAPIGTPDYELAYHYLRRYHSHDFPVSTRTWTHEPTLYLNSLGSGLCDDAATALSMIWRGMGYESRVWLLQGHVVSEVHTGERWQMYDADLEVYYHNRDGQVAGVEELSAAPDLIWRPTNRVSDDPYVYRGRIAQIYATPDNEICSGCTPDVEAKDLIFALPAGGTLQWGDLQQDRALPSRYLQSPEELGLMKLTIPVGASGELDIPLALYDIRGNGRDSVLLGDQALPLDGQHVFDAVNEDTTQPARLQTVTYGGHTEPIDVYYFVNSKLTAVQPSNRVEITQPADSDARLQATIGSTAYARSWNFEPDTEHEIFGPRLPSTPADSALNFGGSHYWDTQQQGESQQDAGEKPVEQLLQGDSEFDLSAKVSLAASGAGTRRPIFDAFRFSLEIDAQNRPYVYYRDANGRWTGVRGVPLSHSRAYQIDVSYRQGRIELTVDGQVQGARHGGGIAADYTFIGPMIGKSLHMGGMYFQGNIYEVSLQEPNIAAAQVRTESVASLQHDAR